MTQPDKPGIHSDPSAGPSFVDTGRSPECPPTPTDAFAAAARSKAALALQQRIGLPGTYLEDLQRHVAPLAAALARRARSAGRPLLVGLNGCQGSGKSTMAQFLALMLQHGAGLRSAVVSIDDFYLTRSARTELARDVHPLLETRGVPGTHDLALANGILSKLLASCAQKNVHLPVFDKAEDDRAPVDQWPQAVEMPHFVVLEGWCVGCPPEDAQALDEPANALEQQEDPDGTWRRYVNHALGDGYRELFARIDYLVMLRAPDFDCVFRWRKKQEQQLLNERLAHDAQADTSKALGSAEALHRFVQHFERLTRYQLATLPALASGVIALNANHRLTAHTGPLFR